MKPQGNTRAQQTRERLRETAQRLFLQQGYQATSVDAILAAAGISSRETFYRHYAGKEELFVDVLSHLTMEHPGFSEKLAALPRVHDLLTLRQVLTVLAREFLFVMNQPEYQALMRITIAEAPRFPQLGPLFFAAIPQHGLSLIMALLQEAKEQQIIADVDFEAMARMLLGGLLTYAIQGLLFVGEQVQPPSFDRADAFVEIMIRALHWEKDALFSPFSNGKRITRIEFQQNLPETPYPCPVMLPQHETEALLTEHLTLQGGAIEWSTELAQFSQQEGSVEAILRHSDGQEEHIQVEWLVGCDGAHSAVRHGLHLDFEGDTLEQSFAVGNVHMNWGLPIDEMYVFVRKGSFIAFFPCVTDATA